MEKELQYNVLYVTHTYNQTNTVHTDRQTLTQAHTNRFCLLALKDKQLLFCCVYVKHKNKQISLPFLFYIWIKYYAVSVRLWCEMNDERQIEKEGGRGRNGLG